LIDLLVHRLSLVPIFILYSRSIVIVDWVNPNTGETVEFHRLKEGEVINVNSFTNHSFSFRSQNDTCADQVCRAVFITVNDNDDQVIKVKDGLEIQHRDSKNKASFSAADIVEICQSNAEKLIAGGSDKALVMKGMLNCVEGAAADAIQKLTEEKRFESTLRESISAKVENYTCADTSMETTKAKEIRPWKHEGENVTRNVHILHERKGSNIHMLENFISEEECNAITDAARPLLHRGTVADGKGGSKLSDHRKAMQAGIRVPWEKEEEGDLIARVVRRLYDYTNHATGYGLEVEGQEDLMSIQYFGRGKEDQAPDRYMPHCDGDCNGLPHKRGGRVATMVMYCDTEGLVGGATNFGNSGVYVKPQVGAAAFFSYLDNETRIHETGFTSHSGCPVVEGRKRIAVHWMRIGVDKDNIWSDFDTNNVLKQDCEED